MTTEAAPRIIDDLPCANCGYNLRTLARDGRCPECNTSVADSLAAQPERFSFPEIRRLRIALIILVAGWVACGAGVMLAMSWPAKVPEKLIDLAAATNLPAPWLAALLLSNDGAFQGLRLIGDCLMPLGCTAWTVGAILLTSIRHRTAVERGVGIGLAVAAAADWVVGVIVFALRATSGFDGFVISPAIHILPAALFFLWIALLFRRLRTKRRFATAVGAAVIATAAQISVMAFFAAQMIFKSGLLTGEWLLLAGLIGGAAVGSGAFGFYAPLWVALGLAWRNVDPAGSSRR